MKNPNEYDDEAFSYASVKLMDAVGAMWEAGAELDNIEADIQSALENEGVDTDVSILPK